MTDQFPLTLQEGGIALIRLDAQPGEAHAVCPPPLEALVAALQAAAERTDVQGVLLHASGPSWLPEAGAQAWLDLCRTGDANAIAAVLQRRSGLLRAVERLPKPIAIVIEGACMDLCLEFALACHARWAVPGARLGLPLVKRGLPPGAGATQRLPRLAGIPAVLNGLLAGDSWEADAARQMGLLSGVQSLAQALQDARDWLLAHPQAQAPWDAKGYRLPGGAGAMAAHAGHSFTDNIARLRKSSDTQPAPLALLSAVYEGTQLPIDAALKVEAQCAAQALAEPATANQIRSLWLHQVQARQLVRRPVGAPEQPVCKLGVLGSGLMGAGIAQVAAAAGIDVVLVDTSAERAQAAHGKIAAALARSHGDRAAAIAQRIEPTADLQRLHGCEFIIEAVFEDRAVKADLMARAAPVLADRPAHFVWASNTSTLPIGGLASAWALPEQVIGMHFFSPVPRMPLLEIILGARTDPATVARTLDLAARLGKTPILVNDSPGFYTSRIFCSYIDEGMAMLAEGVNPALIENAARQAGFATAPLAVTDEVSLDLQALVIGQARKDGLEEKFLRTLAQPVVERMNQLQRLGRKSGGGFYEYPESGKHLWPGLAQQFPQSGEQPDLDTVMARLLCIEAMESARCLEEGVLTSAADGDLGALLGLGFPAWTGGTFSYIDTVGCAAFVQRCDVLADRFGERFRPSAWLRDRAARGLRFHP
jgi:3-hydroxyacyl-CoA dehydrogenase/enoyl-CoA hydratase/3-hydroxybutyryl-CoA epimerase